MLSLIQAVLSPFTHAHHSVDKVPYDCIKGAQHGNPELVAGLVDVRVIDAKQRGAYFNMSFPSSFQKGHQFTSGLVELLSIVTEQCGIIQGVGYIFRVAVTRHWQLYIPTDDILD